MRKSINYKKLNLRDFRHNLTSLKDALDSGQVYQVYEKNKPLAYFIPAQYEVEIKEKKEKRNEEFRKLLHDIAGKFEVRKTKNPNASYKEIYHEYLRKKYLSK